ncbi:MAG: DUF1905 domain-containing protein [Actinomycetes bacterium]
MSISISGEVWYWRGPSPFHFLRASQEESDEINFMAGHLSYGWGCIPARVVIGKTTFTTALIPKDGIYLIPLKASVRKAEELEVGTKFLANVHFH